MNTKSIVDRLKLKLICGEIPDEFSGVYAGDLLSRAMSHAGEGNLWITIINNINVIAVASLTEVAAVIFAEGVEASEEMISAAQNKRVTLLSSDLTVYQICCLIGETVSS